MNEMRSQAWVACLESAFMELDARKLIERIGTAEAAIDARLFALRNDRDHHKERELIADAQRTLRSLRHMEQREFSEIRTNSPQTICRS
jgi:hypothetical protein